MIVGRASVGRYEIESHLASGGMAEVYLARDAGTGARVALKIPHDGEEIWEAERTGAALQVELSRRDPRVPRVLEIGDGDERFVAMEYVAGEDLARRLKSGPLDWREAAAIAIELCGVLATARSCAAVAGEPGGIVHGDIKPRNIRIEESGRIKVLDFGIAKALRSSRAETRNVYGSVPYSSPERLDRGHVDYHSDLWSVAVVLYEMLEGRRPFRAPSDPELERAIRSGARPAPLERDVPRAFQAVLNRALAPALADRYPSAEALAADLRAALAEGDGDWARGTAPVNGAAVRVDADGDATRRTVAEPAPASDPDATRRTSNGAAHAAASPDAGEATRRTRPAPAAAAPVVAVEPAGVALAAPLAAGTAAGLERNGAAHAAAHPPRSWAEAGEPAPAGASEPPRARGIRVPPLRRFAFWKPLLLVVLLVVTGREIQGITRASTLRASLASRPRGEAGDVWLEYRGATRGRLLAGLTGIGGAVRDWNVSHADDLISRYRSDTPTIYESGWRSAEGLLRRAATLDPGNRRVQARLEYCRAHLLRIAARDASEAPESMSRYDEAISRFERAARLWPSWGDPHIGLAQIHAYGKRDPDRTAEALERARGAGYPFGEREAALLGDAYRLRAERRLAADTGAFDDDQRFRHLERVRDDLRLALDQYEQVPSYPGVPRHLRVLRARLADVDQRLDELSGPLPFWPFGRR